MQLIMKILNLTVALYKPNGNITAYGYHCRDNYKLKNKKKKAPSKAEQVNS